MPTVSRIDSLPPLDGPLEPNHHPVWTALAGLLVAFVLFQGISLVVTIALLLQVGVTIEGLTTNLETVLADNAGRIIIANTVGQVLGILIPGILLARLHSRHKAAFLRLRGVDPLFLLMSAAGLVALVPVVSWLGTTIDQLPWPQVVRQFEQGQMDLIENILVQDFNLVFVVSMLALTPAICEEVLFRGYFQRQLERGLGVAWGVALSGVIFGLYHLRPTQAIPIALLGAYLAWITWRSRSILPAVLVHLLNNGFAVVVGQAGPGETTEAALETFEVSLAIFLPSVLVFGALIYVMHRYAEARMVSVMDHSRETDERADI